MRNDIERPNFEKHLHEHAEMCRDEVLKHYGLSYCAIQNKATWYIQKVYVVKWAKKNLLKRLYANFGKALKLKSISKCSGHNNGMKRIRISKWCYEYSATAQLNQDNDMA